MQDKLNEKFKVTYGETGGSKQVIWYYISKITLAELITMAEREFSGVPLEKVNLLPGIMNDMITTGTSVEAKSI